MLLDCPHCGAHLLRPHYDGCPGRLEPARDLCVFCGRRPEETGWLAGEPGRHICDRCIDRCLRVLSGADPDGDAETAGGTGAPVGAGVPGAPGSEPDPGPTGPTGPATDGTAVPRFGGASTTPEVPPPPPPPPDVDWYGPPRTDRCGYCGRGRDQVHRLIAGPKVAICDTCVHDIAVQRTGWG